jgi:hypothetical protein
MHEIRADRRSVTPEAARFLDKARLCLADATLYQPIVPRIAGREA